MLALLTGLALLGATMEVGGDVDGPATVSLHDDQHAYLGSITHTAQGGMHFKTAISPGGAPESRMVISSSGDIQCSGTLSAGADVVVNGVSFNSLVKRVEALEAQQAQQAQ